MKLHRWSNSRNVAALLLLVLNGSVSACVNAQTVPASTGDWAGIRNYLVNYTAEGNINKPLFAKYDAAVLEPQVVSATTVAALQLMRA
ncbi:hypothetical protein [Duganella hordei]|uniref:hypothetical protein n=1 Tax=Duganella hordei TaxID=2865934 RepID=UPI0033420A78